MSNRIEWDRHLFFPEDKIEEGMLLAVTLNAATVARLTATAAVSAFGESLHVSSLSFFLLLGEGERWRALASLSGFPELAGAAGCLGCKKRHSSPNLHVPFSLKYLHGGG